MGKILFLIQRWFFIGKDKSKKSKSKKGKCPIWFVLWTSAPIKHYLHKFKVWFRPKVSNCMSKFCFLRLWNPWQMWFYVQEELVSVRQLLIGKPAWDNVQVALLYFAFIAKPAFMVLLPAGTLIDLSFWLEANCNFSIFQDKIAWTTNLTQRIYEFRPEKEGLAWKTVRKTEARNYEWQFDVWNISYGKYQTLSKMSGTYPKIWRVQQNDM